MTGVADFARRQAALAAFGDFVLDHENLDAVLTEACRLVAMALDADLAKVIEIDQAAGEGRVRAGVGWRPGVVGQERIDLSERSSEAFAIATAEPVITNDLAAETRFDFPGFLRDHGVVALINVPVLLPGRTPWGVLQVDATRVRDFDRDDIDFLKTYAMILGPVIDRARVADERGRALESLELREARLEGLLGGMDEGFCLLAPDFTVLELNRQALSLDGRARNEIVGRSHWEAYPGTETSELGQALRRAMAERVPVSLEHRCDRGGGRALWREMRAYPAPDGALAVFWRDITERHEAGEALAESEARLRSAVEVGRLGLWDWHVQTGDLHWSEEHFRMEGYVVGEVTPSYEAWRSRIHPDDRPGAEAALQDAMTDRTDYVREFRVVHPDGAVRWLFGRGRFSYDDAGTPARMIGAMVDTTERRNLEDRQAVLVAELQHRTRNLITLVRALADRTARTSADLSDFRERYRDRLEALARAQGLLSRLDAEAHVTFDALIETELAALGAQDERIRTTGPRGVRLRSSTVQTLAMAIHELATNAVKHGALARPHARLEIVWSLEAVGPDGGPWLHVEWRETGVGLRNTDVAAGQGRELIERALPYQLGARTRYALTPDGVRCSISVPVSRTPAQ